MKMVKFKDFLKRSKIPIDVIDNETYKRVTIRIKHGGVSLRDEEIGKKIGTKKQFVLKAGQFIVSKIDARYGAFGIAPEDVDNAIITGNFWAYNVDFNIIDIEWFNQFTNSQYFYDLCERASSGITHRKYLSEDSFLNNEINLPSLHEQKTSIAFINEIKNTDNQISTEITHQLSILKDLRQAFLREAMQGLLVSNDTSDGKTGADLLAEIKAEKEKLIKEKKIKKPKAYAPISEEEIPFEIPENWTWCRLGELAKNIVYGTSVKTKDKGEIPVLRMGNITTDGKILLNNLKYTDASIDDLPDLYLKQKDLLFNRTNSFELVGKSAVFNLEEKYTCASYLIIVRFLNINFSNFICSYINSNLCRASQLEPNIIQQNGQANFNGTKLGNIIIPLPPLEIQNRIVAKLDDLMAQCDALENQIQQSQTTNTLLLQQVLREALGA